MMETGATSVYRYHEAVDNGIVVASPWRQFLTYEYAYDFENFFHPLVGKLIQALNNAAEGEGVADLTDPTFLSGLANTFFSAPTSTGVKPEFTVATDSVEVSSYPAQIDLDAQLPYANYNWELLYHIPVAVAVHLSQNQRFAEAQKWFHYVFDPTATGPGPAPQRFWKFLYFQQNPQSIDLNELMVLLSTPASQLTSSQNAQVQGLMTSYQASVSTPFDPFAVARSRPIAFQYYVVMKYLDNLIAWGDSLFTQMTIETVTEATLCYVIAANLLGQRPQPVPPAGTISAKCYNDLVASGTLDPLGDALVELEGQFPFNITTPADGGGVGTSESVFGTGQSLYFCVPPNAKLLSYWDTVEDRLAKIRNCENIEGQVQLMPLFDPPIDPGMLVAAAAAGLNIGSVVSGLNQPISPVRAPVLIQKVLELCGEVRALGAELLAALEKGDAEALARLRQNNEIALQQMTQNIRYLQWQQGQAATEALLRGRASALERYTFYLRELGLTPNSTTVPAAFTVDHTTVLTEDNFSDAYQTLVGQYDQSIATQPYPAYQPVQSSSPSAQSGASGTGNLYLNANEDAELNSHMPTARDEHLASEIAEMAAPVLNLIPSVEVELHYWGLGAHTKVIGGDWLAMAAHGAAGILRALATWEQDQGQMAARTAGYQRRADDWLLQVNLAAHELSQIGRQILVSMLTEQAAGAEYTTAKAQVGQSQDVLDFLQTKFTNEELYGWMRGQLSSLYYQYYRLALDTARKAEATAKWELMRPELDATTYVKPNYWDSGHQGLLSGEALYLDVKSLDLDYQTYNLRELELTRHVSLRQLDPLALLNLKITGKATVTIPEWLYDRDCPGHYLRRIKTVSVSIPSVVGPYTTINCALTLQNSSVRVSSELVAGNYARSTTSDDPRFTDYFGSIDSIVTSSAMSDSGMFETNLRDERFLPFEGAGAISTWTLSLPTIPAFDYSTITDVVLHVRYTARDGGAALGAAATKTLATLPPGATGPPPAPTLALLLSLRHDFPTEWYAFTTGGSADFTANLTIDYFPYLVQGADLKVESISVYGASGDQLQVAPSVPVPGSMTSAGIKAGTAVLDIPQDGSVLTSSGPPTAEVYVVIGYTAKL
jgi:Tc toxin complex TcA C-terminal TcB-binding domain